MSGKWSLSGGEITYIGEVCHSLDVKGRVTIPTQFREALGEDFILTRGLDRCLWLQTREQWKEVEDYIRSLDHNIKEARMYARFMLSGACKVELDKQGRMLVPQSLRDYAGLSKDVIFNIGLDYIEVWDKERYYGAVNEFDIDAIATKLNEISPMKKHEE